MSNLSAKLSLLITWTSLPLGTWGFHLRTQAPWFGEWTSHIQSQFDDLPGAGLWILYCWPCAGFIRLSSTSLIIVGIFVMWKAAKSRRQLCRRTSLAIAFGFGLVLLRIIFFAMKSVSWGFYVLAFGDLLLAVGLLFSFAALEQMYG